MYVSLPPEPATRRAGAMIAHAMLESELGRDSRTTRVRTLRSDGPLVLRPCNPKEPEPLVHRRRDVARVALAAGTAGPLGGDSYALDVHVGPGSTLVLTEVSAMLVLPGARGEQSHMTVNVNVGEGATFVWWPEPIIAADRCNHCHNVRIALAEGARMILREEVLLGRHGEAPGNFASRLRITSGGTAIYDQQLSFGPSSDGWDSAAVLGTARAVGTIVSVDPAWADTPLPAVPFHPDAVLTPLAGPGAAIGVVALDSLSLRRLLTRGLNELGSPWVT